MTLFPGKGAELLVRWSWKIGEFAGIGVFVHTTFLLLIAWVVASYVMRGYNLATTIDGVVFILALFLCVVLHEFGHALTAKKYGIKTRDITLYPIGGMARLERLPEEPRQELHVALAGPLVSIAIAAVLFVWLQLTSGWEPISQLSVISGSFFERLMIVNLILALFNLLPAFPMDGGRVLRAFLATRMDFLRATQIAANIGQGTAFLFGFIGLFFNPFLIFIALFVWIGAAQESSMVQMRAALGGIPVERVMLSDFRVLSPHDSLSQAVEQILPGYQQDFPVLDDGRLVGILTRGDFLVALAHKNRDVTVAEVMKGDYQTADASEMLETVFTRLHSCDCHAMPVVKNGQLVGLISMDNVGEFVRIQTALGSTIAESVHK